ncbi:MULTISPECIES: BID domain-containing T4SS effector [unclassified Bartonella]|uniref:BID domain-containing T4SS effector n=1 Tax=unclassified Bartonella TaxID=2645622 RepID=UPI00235FD3DC|nr:MULTISPECIES: BID domain-containing T4SS effector [unclassified Bartonella]
MKKKHLSPSVARLVETFERNNEQSTATPTPPTQNTQKPPLAKHPEHLSHTKVTPPHPPHTSEDLQSNTTPQESQTPQRRTAPQRPPRARERQQNNTPTQETLTAQVRVAPQRPPRARDKELNLKQAQQEEGIYATPTPQAAPRGRGNTQNPKPKQEDEGIYATPAPQKPPRTRGGSVKQQPQEPSTPTPQAAPQGRGSTQNPKPKQDSEPIYTELEIKTPPPTSNRQRRGAITEQEQTIYTQVASSGMTASLSKEEMTTKIRNNAFVQGCKDEIQALSQTVYGNPNIFQKNLEEIEQNPILGESLSWQVAANPKLVGDLAGKKVLGVKNQARREAEENITPLCFALENYAETVKKVRESIVQGHRAGQTLRRSSMDLKQMAEDLQKPRKAEQEMGTLSQKEMARRVQSSSMVQYCHAEIIYWCTVAYGNPRILQYRLEEIQKVPDMAENLAWQVTNHPDTFGKLAGHSLYSLKNEARKQAEIALPRLGEAIEGYAEAIKHAKENILQSQEAKQQRHAPPPPQEQSKQRQQSLSAPPQTPERSSTHQPQATAQTSTQTHWEQLGAKPRTTLAPKQQRQERTPSPSPTQTKRHAPPPPQEQSVQRQQSLSEFPQTPKHSSTHRNQATVEATTQTEQSPQTVRPRMVRTPQTKKTPSLSLKEIAARVQSDLSVQRALIEVYNYSNIVYDDPFVFKYQTEDIQKIPVLGEELSWQVANYPKIFASLSGRQMLGIKDNARKNAEEALPSLCSAIDRYTETVKQARKDIVKAHEKQQKLQEQSPQQEENRQRQQSLSESPELPERSARGRHQEASETSMQAEKNSQTVRSRKAESSSKAMALSG